MKIAQVAPLFESVPPDGYGGTERVVANLTDQLLDLGHEVTLFSSGDSQSRAEIVPVCPRALRLDGGCRDYLAWHVLMTEWVVQQAERFDIVHFHIGHMHFPVVRRLRTPHVTTLHGRLDLPELVPLYREFSDVHLISISQSQRQPLPEANWTATIPHGLPDTFEPREEPGSYFAFLGRICPEKRVDRAIAIATAVGYPLKIAAKIDPSDVRYFEQEIKPLLDHPLVEFVGEISEGQKSEFLGRARALLFPIDWPEPFGLVLVESLACGTPVIAFRNGSVPEIIDDQHTGFIVETIDEAIEAARRVESISRRACRRAFEQRFTARRMVKRYLATYARVIASTSDRAA